MTRLPEPVPQVRKPPHPQPVPAPRPAPDGTRPRTPGRPKGPQPPKSPRHPRQPRSRVQPKIEVLSPEPPAPPRRPPALARGFATNPDRVGTAREVMTYLARRPWLQLDVVDIILGTQFDRDDVAHALIVLQQTGRILSHLRGDRVCYSYATT